MKNSYKIAAGVAALAMITSGSAVAADLIGSKDIKDDSVHSKDIHDYTIKKRDLRENVWAALSKDEVGTGTQGPKGDTGATGPAGKDGAAGAAGAKGDKGDAGSNGVSGYEVRTYDYDLVSGGGIATVTCPVGKVALGGGYVFKDAAAQTNGTTVIASFPGVMNWDTNAPKATGDPLVDSRGWIVQVNKPNNVNPGAMTLYVTCATMAAAAVN